MSALHTYKVGQVIELKDGRSATVRFLGATYFADGDWIGVELDEPTGKNDGSVQGTRYFDCTASHGMFLRPTGVSQILQQAPPAKTASTIAASRKEAVAAATTRARPNGPLTTSAANNVRRQAVVDQDAAKRQSMNAVTPTPAQKRQSTVALKVPAKPVPKPTSTTAPRAPVSTAASRLTTSRLSNPGRTSLAGTSSNAATKRSPTAAEARTTAASSRTSLARPLATRTAAGARPAVKGTTKPVQPSTTRPSATDTDVGSARERSEEDESESVQDEEVNENGSVQEIPEASVRGEKDDSDLEDADKEAPHTAHDDDEGRRKTQPQRPAPSTTTTATAPKPLARPAPSRVTADGRHIQELEAQLRVLEKKRKEDREMITALEKVQTEKDRFEKVIEKLQVKLGRQSAELTTLKATLKEAEDSLTELRDLKDDYEGQLEMATLDREMAEEMAEASRTELDILRQKTEEVELEVAVLREENEEFERGINPEERSSQGWLQMERSNERLREALLRLRDITRSKESELQERITTLEEESKHLTDIETKFLAAKSHLQKSEGVVEDLKQQLEASLASEDMVEQLSETNSRLNEEIAQLKTEVDELQTINELNDEFELQHTENERQMQDEIDARGTALAERMAIIVDQDSKLADYEHTIAKFRDLVTSLQTHIADMKSSQQISDAEAADLSSRSRAMADLNLKLRSSAAKTQSNAIDLELRRLEAQEAIEHLGIIQLFLPDTFGLERDAVLVYLRFKRVIFKARMLHGLLKDKASRSDVVEDVSRNFMRCRVMNLLWWVAGACEMCVNDVRRASPDRFLQFQECHDDIELVERSMNGYVEAWRQDDFREQSVAEELQRSRAVLSHVVEVRVAKKLGAFADQTVVQMSLAQAALETGATALTWTASLFPRLEAQAEDSDAESDSWESAMKGLLKAIGGRMRNTKVILGRVQTTLDDLRARGLSFPTSDQEAFSSVLDLATDISDNAQKLGLMMTATSAEDESEPTSLRERLNVFREELYSGSKSDVSPLDPLKNHVEHLLEQASALAARVAQTDVAESFEIHTTPWNLRAQKMKDASADTVANEAELQRLRKLIQDRVSQIRARDVELEEQKVKIEFLESRSKDMRDHSRQMEELQKQLQQGKKRENQLVSVIDRQEKYMHQLKEETDRLNRLVTASTEAGKQNDRKQTVVSGRAVTITDQQLQTQQLEVTALRQTVQMLRADDFSRRFTTQHSNGNLEWLSESLFPVSAKSRADTARLREGEAILDMIIKQTQTSQLVDLTLLPKNKLAWRPAKSTSAWLVLKQKQQWERCLGQCNAFLNRVANQRVSG